MLLFVVLINDSSFLLSSRRKKFSSLLWSQANICFLLVAEFHLKCWDVSISPLQAYSFCCWFSNNPVTTFLEGFFPSSFVAEVGIFFSILLFQWYIFYSFFRRHGDVALFTHHLELWGSCSFCAYPFNRQSVLSLQVLFILSSLASLFNRSAIRFWSSSFLVYLVSTRVVPILSCPLYSSFITFQPLKVLWFHSLVAEAT